MNAQMRKKQDQLRKEELMLRRESILLGLEKYEHVIDESVKGVKAEELYDHSAARLEAEMDEPPFEKVLEQRFEAAAESEPATAAPSVTTPRRASINEYTPAEVVEMRRRSTVGEAYRLTVQMLHRVSAKASRGDIETLRAT